MARRSKVDLLTALRAARTHRDAAQKAMESWLAGRGYTDEIDSLAVALIQHAAADKPHALTLEQIDLVCQTLGDLTPRR